jgi:D,D-heptose 1,7-bisphosphate phosphatase
LELIPQNRAVFVDRDGTINRDVPYCSRPEDFELLAGVGEGIRLLNENGYKVIVITNQSGIARGYFTEETLEEIHQKMRQDLKAYHARVDAIYYCPHHPDEGCDCRKPNPKMVFEAAKDLNCDISKSYVIGDSEKDIEMGLRAGCNQSLMINSNGIPNTGQGLFRSFKEAVNWLLVKK